ncbi:MAG: transcriptional regulator [Bacteroidales bacterium]|nr:transcriptional regulator [Bacteroidales bacterium]
MGKNWYALKVFFNKVFEAEAGLEEMGIETYFPVSLKEVKGDEFFRIKKRLSTPDSSRNDNKYICEGPRIFKRAPVVNSLVFFRTEPKSVSAVSEMIRGRGFVYMNAERQKPAIIPERQMEMFRMVSSSGADGIEFFSEKSIVSYAKGDRVRVTMDGPLKGAEGYIKRIKKDRRLLVAIEGFIAVATAHIPPEYLEKVQE